MFVFETGRLIHPRYVVNFPTKRHWRDKSRMEDIVSGLRALVAEVQARLWCEKSAGPAVVPRSRGVDR